MIEAYNWKTNILEIKDKYNNHYKLELRGNKNIVKGESGTGKTYLAKLIESIKKRETLSEYNVDNIIILNLFNIDQLRTFKDKLIIIDRADYILEKQDVIYINSDINNRYLIFSKVPLGIDLSPNHQADFVTNDTITIMEYRFNVKGWG